MSNAVGWLRFSLALWPDAKQLIADLYRWHKGDVEAARQALSRIRDHGQRLDVKEGELDARMQAVRDREQS